MDLVAEGRVVQPFQHVRVPRDDPHPLAARWIDLRHRPPGRADARVERVPVRAGLGLPQLGLGKGGYGRSSSSAEAAAETTVARCCAVSSPASTKAFAVAVTVDTNAPWFANGA